MKLGLAALSLLLCSAQAKPTLRSRSLQDGMNFNRIATYNVCKQIDENCNNDNETVAEIVTATADGNTVVYTDGARGAIGLLDITDPTMPVGLGVIDVGGEPTSVAVKGDYALAAVNTSPDFVNPSGKLVVFDIGTGATVAEFDLGGQPDSIAISPDGTYAAVAIENERDEDITVNGVEGGLPQLPAGFLVIMDISSADPTMWTLTTTDLTGLDGVLYNMDPEPEYVDINADNSCVVTLQENNGLALVDLVSGNVTASFTAGAVDLEQIDIVEDGVIMATGSQTQRLREPDAVAWIGTEYFAIANEGDLDGGSRGFSIFDSQGSVVYEAGNALDWLTIRYGHYPESRSENKGNEPEGIAYATFGEVDYLFVTSERGSVIFVYDVTDVTSPVFKQILPVNVAPEGIKAIPDRNLLVISCEEDSREDKIRAGVVIFELQEAAPAYPTLISEDRPDGTPIPFSALSGLASAAPLGTSVEVSRQADADKILYTVEDSAYKQSRMLTIDVSEFPYKVVSETRISDADGVFAGALAGAGLNSSAFINADNTINVDPEGISISSKGGFWVVHEGSGTFDDPERPIESPNVLFKLTDAGIIEKVVLLPAELNAVQLRFGFEGVAEDGSYVVVAFQRAWNGEANPRLGIYNQDTEEWKFVFYPLDAPESQNGGWVGLSDISSIGAGNFLVVERDDQGGPDAAIKKIYQIDLGRFDMEEGTTISKTLLRDLMPDLAMPKGNIYEKIEGMAVTSSGEVYIVNDNDGVDTNSGEQQLMNLGVLITEAPTLPPLPETEPTSGADDRFNKTLYAGLLISVGVLWGLY